MEASEISASQVSLANRPATACGRSMTRDFNYNIELCLR